MHLAAQCGVIPSIEDPIFDCETNVLGIVNVLKACVENERNAILIEGEHIKAVVHQIAGFIARRIACWVQPGDPVRLGQRLGLIRFGSQVDLYLSQSVEVCVKKGDRVVSGVTVVAISKGVIEKMGVPVLERQKA